MTGWSRMMRSRAAYEWARKIAEGAPLSARWHKKFIYRLLDPTPLTQPKRTRATLLRHRGLPGGFKAFLEKKTSFNGR